MESNKSVVFLFIFISAIFWSCGKYSMQDKGALETNEKTQEHSPLTGYDQLIRSAILEIENNYAGFKDKTSGREYQYQAFKTELLEEHIAAREILDSLLNEYTNYFQDDHLFIWNEKDTQEYLEKDIDPTPSFKELNTTTTYLRLPSFDVSFKKDIDSLVYENLTSISKHDNLIIDLRGNGGGQDLAFNALIPLLYTNPIYIHNIDFYVTKENKTSRIDSATQTQNMGEMVPMFGQDHLLEIFEGTKPLDKPRNIAILIDRDVASSAEQFILYARQSRKVKLFGENTKGAIDYSNLRVVWLIDEKLAYTIPMTKSQRLPNNPIDETGIQPDFYLQNTGENAIKEVLKIIELW